MTDEFCGKKCKQKDLLQRNKFNVVIWKIFYFFYKTIKKLALKAWKLLCFTKKSAFWVSKMHKFCLNWCIMSALFFVQKLFLLKLHIIFRSIFCTINRIYVQYKKYWLNYVKNLIKLRFLIPRRRSVDGKNLKKQSKYWVFSIWRQG